MSDNERRQRTHRQMSPRPRSLTSTFAHTFAVMFAVCMFIAIVPGLVFLAFLLLSYIVG